MTKEEFFRFISYLQQKKWQVFGPQKIGTKILIRKIHHPGNLYLGPKIPDLPFKKFFLPPKEVLFHFKDHKILPLTPRKIKKAIFGINILDLKIILLYDLVFKQDPYYLQRRKNLLIVGWGAIPPPTQNLFKIKFDKKILSHLKFDIFLAPKEAEFEVFCGSNLGKKILEDFNYKKYCFIKFEKPLAEQNLIAKFKDKLIGPDAEVWQKLGQICIECGKCTLVCPTCFCFALEDRFNLKNRKIRERSWDSCFYSEFSEVAGGHEFLDTTPKRIYFWYYHKFSRIPDEYGLLGCVGCQRCTRICPVGLDIAKTLNQIAKSK